MNLGELRAYARTNLDDLAEPYLWSDQYLDQLINNAVLEASIRSHRCAPSTTVVLDILAMDRVADKPTDLLRTLSVQVIGSTVDGPYTKYLLEKSMASLQKNDVEWTTRVSEVPTCFFQDIYKIGVYPEVPSDIQVSLEYMTSTVVPLIADIDVPALPVIWHHQLVLWVMYEALRILDADANNDSRAKECHDGFEKTFGPKPSANMLASMSMMSPNQTINRVRM